MRGSNRYDYANNAPTTFIDPSGQAPGQPVVTQNNNVTLNPTAVGPQQIVSSQNGQTQQIVVVGQGSQGSNSTYQANVTYNQNGQMVITTTVYVASPSQLQNVADTSQYANTLSNPLSTTATATATSNGVNYQGTLTASNPAIPTANAPDAAPNTAYSGNLNTAPAVTYTSGGQTTVITATFNNYKPGQTCHFSINLSTPLPGGGVSIQNVNVDVDAPKY